MVHVDTYLNKVHDGHGYKDDGCTEQIQQGDGYEGNVRSEGVTLQSVDQEAN